MGRADRAALAVGYLLLLVLGAAIGVWGAFLVPVRLPGGVEGLADVVGFAGPLVVGYLGAVGLGVAPAAVFPGIGWIVSILGSVLLLWAYPNVYPRRWWQ